MATVTNMLPANVPLIDAKGLMARPWWQYFNGQNRTANAAVAGEIQTDPGSGLQGGGFVADGLDLSIATNGVTFAMFQELPACSVVGRFQNSTGDTSAVIATQNRTVLGRQGGGLAFFPYVDVPAVATDALTINDTPAVSTATVTHSIPIETDAGTMYILLSNVP